MSPYGRVDFGGNRETDWILWKDTLWPPYRTFICRPDLARMTEKVSVTAYDKDVGAEIDPSAIFPGDVQFLSVAKVSLHQMVGG
jgi:hypothetical protein